MCVCVGGEWGYVHSLWWRIVGKVKPRWDRIFTTYYDSLSASGNFAIMSRFGGIRTVFLENAVGVFFVKIFKSLLQRYLSKRRDLKAGFWAHRTGISREKTFGSRLESQVFVPTKSPIFNFRLSKNYTENVSVKQSRLHVLTKKQKKTSITY